jgi:ribosome maturation factor RimP
MRTIDPASSQAWLEVRARAAAEAEGCELVELRLKGHGASQRLEVVVYRAGGVGIEDCARVSRALRARLDAEGADAGGRGEPAEHEYILEVSSPGVDRRLVGTPEYDIFRGRLARLSLNAPLEGRVELSGALGGLTQDRRAVRIGELALGREVEVPLAQITQAQLAFEDPQARTATRAPAGTSKRASERRARR